MKGPYTPLTDNVRVSDQYMNITQNSLNAIKRYFYVAGEKYEYYTGKKVRQSVT
jgi:hypothetical protein